jgi:phage terminase large subunit
MMLKFRPNPRQRIATERWADRTTNEICFGGAKYGGKSFLGGVCIFSDALTYDETYYFIAREQLSDLRKYTIPTIYEVFQYWDINLDSYAKYNGHDNYFKLHNKSRVYLLECKFLPSDPFFERFGSMQMTRGWIEEAGQVHRLAKENLFISTGRKNNDKYNLIRKCLYTCNPKKNWLYSEFYKPASQGLLPANKAFISSLPKDNIFGNKEYIAAIMNIKDEVMRQRLALGNWEYDDDPSRLMDYDSIVDIFSNEHVETKEKYITADIARFGSDRTVIGLWNGWRCEKVYSFLKSSITESSAEIRELMTLHAIPTSHVIVDEDGVGGGMKDILGCKGFVNNSRALKINGKEENYANLKSQCWFHFAERVNEKQVYVNCIASIRQLLVEELEQIKDSEPDSEKRKQVLNKEQIKQVLGRSPDIADMLMMHEWFEIANVNAPIKVSW